MKQLNLVLFALVLVYNSSKAQTYQRDNATLNIFTINDTLKYFEFYTPEFLHENVEVGILKSNGHTYTLKYTDGSNFASFDLMFQGDSVRVKKLSTRGYMAYGLNEKLFLKISDSTSQIVSQFHLNHPILYKAKKRTILKVYEYPAFESKVKQISFNKGGKIEQKWSVGFYNKYKPITDKTWAAIVCGSRFIGWLLLSDVEANFEKVKE